MPGVSLSYDCHHCWMLQSLVTHMEVFSVYSHTSLISAYELSLCPSVTHLQEGSVLSVATSSGLLLGPPKASFSPPTSPVASASPQPSILDCPHAGSECVPAAGTLGLAGLPEAGAGLSSSPHRSLCSVDLPSSMLTASSLVTVFL